MVKHLDFKEFPCWGCEPLLKGKKTGDLICKALDQGMQTMAASDIRHGLY